MAKPRQSSVVREAEEHDCLGVHDGKSHERDYSKYTGVPESNLDDLYDHSDKTVRTMINQNSGTGMLF